MGLESQIEILSEEQLNPSNIVSDGYVMSDEMLDKYKQSTIESPEGQLLPVGRRYRKNASIFDVRGIKIWWGDICPDDVRRLKGVYYVLSQSNSYMSVPEEAIIKWNFLEKKDPNSRSAFRHLLPVEPTVLDINYVKKKAIARIIDGKMQTSDA